MARKIVNSEFGKNVLTLMTGTTIAQLIPLLLTPVLTRLFSPEEFGLFAFYLSLITFLGVISAGRYEQAIVLPKEDKEAVNILVLSLFILLAFVSVLIISLLLFGSYIESLIDIPVIHYWLWFIPLGVLLSTIYRIFTFWSNRKKRFRGTSFSVMSQSSGRASVQLGGGLEKFSVLSDGTNIGSFFKTVFNKAYLVPAGVSSFGISSLILSYFIGFFFGSIVLVVPFLRKDRGMLKFVSKSEMKRQAKIYEKFPKISSFHALGDEFKNVGVTSTILFMFGDVLLGFYSMTYRILRAPLSVIGNSFGQVFFQKAAEMHANEENYVPLITKTVQKLTIIAAPIFVTILLFGPDLFEFVLGEKWRLAGVYAQYLTPWLFLSFIVAPVQQVAVILNKQGELFMFSLLGNAIIVGSIFIGGYLFDDLILGFIMLSSLQIGYCIWIYLWIKKIAKENYRKHSASSDSDL